MNNNSHFMMIDRFGDIRNSALLDPTLTGDLWASEVERKTPAIIFLKGSMKSPRGLVFH
jgi:hypothetical protein